MTAWLPKRVEESPSPPFAVRETTRHYGGHKRPRLIAAKLLLHPHHQLIHKTFATDRCILAARLFGFAVAVRS
jgi:hypothetical protein